MVRGMRRNITDRILHFKEKVPSCNFKVSFDFNDDVGELEFSCAHVCYYENKDYIRREIAFSRSESSKTLKKSSISTTESEETSSMFLPPIVIARISFLSLFLFRNILARRMRGYVPFAYRLSVLIRSTRTIPRRVTTLQIRFHIP